MTQSELQQLKTLLDKAHLELENATTIQVHEENGELYLYGYVEYVATGETTTYSLKNGILSQETIEIY